MLLSIKNKVTKSLAFIWGHRNLKYTTILLLLITGLFLTTDGYKTLFRSPSQDVGRGYFFYMPSQHSAKGLSRLENLIVRKLAKTNDLEFVKVKPLNTAELRNLLAFMEQQKHLDATTMVFNLVSFIKDYKAGLLRSYNGNALKLDDPTAGYHDDINFLKWLSGIDNFHTSFKNITPYDDTIKKYAREFGIDWRLIAAQMFIESSYNPKSLSFAGAMGLMQITPIAMKEMGARNPYNVDQNIYHGIKYLRSRLDLFRDIPKHSRQQFALASYNAGIGHLRDAQRLALRKGLDPSKWKNNLDEMFLDLSFYDDTHEDVWYGYCRGEETVNYVKKIMSRYTLYKNLVYSE